ncbi:helix-turn-helix domain-containing protein [Streptomyces sp. NPDC007945]
MKSQVWRARGTAFWRGMTLDEVGERLGVSAKTVERWINNPKRQPNRSYT